VARGQTWRTRRLDRWRTGAHDGAKGSGTGGGLAALFCVASLTTRLRAARYGVSYRYLFMHPSGADLAYLASLIEAEKLEVVIDRVFPFAEAKEAVGYLETGRAKGKVVLAMR